MPVITELGKRKQKDQLWLSSEFKDRHEETLPQRRGLGSVHQFLEFMVRVYVIAMHSPPFLCLPLPPLIPISFLPPPLSFFHE